MDLEGQGSECKPFGRETGLTLTLFPWTYSALGLFSRLPIIPPYRLVNWEVELEKWRLNHFCGHRGGEKSQEVITCWRSKGCPHLCALYPFLSPWHMSWVPELLKKWGKSMVKTGRDFCSLGLEDSAKSLCLSHPWETSSYKVLEDYCCKVSSARLLEEWNATFPSD